MHIAIASRMSNDGASMHCCNGSSHADADVSPCQKWKPTIDALTGVTWAFLRGWLYTKFDRILI